MSVGEERLRLGEERRLIFQNFCNQVPKEDIAEAFQRSVEGVERELVFVTRKIAEYRHRRCINPHPDQGMLPPIPCDTETEILMNRGPLLHTLHYIGPETLASDLVIPTLATQTIDRVEYAVEAARAVGARVRDTR